MTIEEAWEEGRKIRQEETKHTNKIYNVIDLGCVRATRHNKDKAPYSQIDYASLESLAKVLGWGEKKYARSNWRKPMSKFETLDSLQRHVGELIDKANEGKDEVDHETGIDIVGHCMANLMFYAYHKRNGSFTENINSNDKDKGKEV